MEERSVKISVIIHTLNADKFLGRVLDSVKDFDEIIICDMYSDDQTIEIAKKYNCRIVYHDRVGIVEPARMYAASFASHNWILFVDADEIVTSDLKNFLYSAPKNYPQVSAIQIPRKNYFMGRFMKCAYPDYIIRFFKKDKVTFSPIIHSKPNVNGLIISIDQNRKELAFIHLANDSIKDTINKMNKYTDFELERRKKRKYNLLSLIFEPQLRFLRFYIFKGGIRDGLPGFIWACMYAYYKFITIAKVKEYNYSTDESKMDNDLKI